MQCHHLLSFLPSHVLVLVMRHLAKSAYLLQFDMAML